MAAASSTRATETASPYEALLRDERGAYFILFALCLPVLIAAFGLAIESGRLFLLQTQLQNVADAAALGAASRLDGSKTAIAAARAAVQALDNRATAARFDGNLSSEVTLRFAASLEDLDARRWLAEDQGARARLVSAEVNPQHLAFSVARWIGAQAAPVALSAEAVASSRFAACQVTPLMLCLRDFAPLRFERGAMYRLPLKTQGAALASGDLVAVDPPMTDDTPPLDGFAGNLAGPAPRFCATTHVRPRLAPAATVARALNTRFDLYPADMTDLAVPAAPDTIKGLVLQPPSAPGDSLCRFMAPAGAAKLSRDACFGNGTCASLPSGFAEGDGQWARDDYWSKNHSGQAKPAHFSKLSRYEIYLLELGIDPSGAVARPSAAGHYAPNGQELLPSEGASTCASRKGIPTTGTYARRIVEIAISACGDEVALNERTDLSGSSFGKFFMTEPMDAASGALYLEFIEMLTPATDDGGKLRQIVELVR